MSRSKFYAVCLGAAVLLLYSTAQAQWPRRYDNGFGDDAATTVAVDHNGNVYVAGTVTSQYNGLDFGVISYDANGYVRSGWPVTFDGDAHADDIATGVCVDWQGNCYVCGVSDNGNHPKFTVLRIDKNGNKPWPTSGSGGSGSNAYEFDHGSIRLNDSHDDGVGHFAGEGALCAIAIEDVAGVQPTLAISGPSTSGTYNRWRTVVFEDDGFGAVQIKSGWPVDESTSVEDEDQSYAVAISSADHTVFMTGGQVLPLDNLRTKDA